MSNYQDFVITVDGVSFEARWYAADPDDPCVKIRRPGDAWLRESDDGCATRAEAEEMARTLAAEQLDAERLPERSPKLVIGAGESTLAVIRNAESDHDTMLLAWFLFPEHVERAEWAVLVDAEESDLDQDRAVIRYRTVTDFDAAIGACKGIDPRDPALRAEAVKAMLDADVIL